MAYFPVRGNVYQVEPVVVPLLCRVGIHLENSFHDLDGGLANACGGGHPPSDKVLTDLGHTSRPSSRHAIACLSGGGNAAGPCRWVVGTWIESDGGAGV